MSGSFDLRRVRYFIRVAELGSLTRAAEALHVAQPALSQQIRLLETELDEKLFVRGPRGVALTDAGARLLTEARGLLDGIGAIVERVKSGPEPEGRVVIGVGQSIGSLLVVPLLQRAAERLPGVRITVREMVGGLLPDLMRSGSVDFALSLNTVGGHGVRFVAVLSEEMHLVGQRHLVERHLVHSRNGGFNFRDLDGLPLLLSRRGQFVRDAVERAARSKAIALNLRAEVDSLHLQKELVLSGAGCCILSSSNLRREAHDHDLYMGRITAPLIRREVFLLLRGGLSRAACEVLWVALETLEQMVKDGTWEGAMMATTADIRRIL